MTITRGRFWLAACSRPFVIYLQISVTRSQQRLSSSESEVISEFGLADIVVATDDAAAASMLAADVLQLRQWKPIAITTAEQGYFPDDFQRHPAAPQLYDAALHCGYGLSIVTTPPVEPMDTSGQVLRTA